MTPKAASTLMKKQLVSFRDFLKTGTLGPVYPGMKMIEIAKVLGAPDDWLTEYAEAVPEYWFYGTLEASFDKDPPHELDWFQIEHVHAIRGKTERITDQFVLSMEGLNGRTKPSEFLEAGLWAPDEVKIFYAKFSDWEFTLDLCAGPVHIFFRVDIDFIENGEIERYLSKTSVAQIISDIDRRTVVDSIYSYRHPSSEQRRIELDWKVLTGNEHLALVRQHISPKRKGARRPL
ncbi:hypothetical protein [Mesorhizobium sp. M0895]|uniref:hypothetical protein n=3 Tax=unclassified Mesorhizobium TaxID=325217 RepID=UPI003334D965